MGVSPVIRKDRNEIPPTNAGDTKVTGVFHFDY